MPKSKKVQAYNDFSDGISFGNPYTVIASDDPDEHEKAIKYTDIIANSVMLQNMIKQQSQMICYQQNRINELEKKVQSQDDDI